MRVPCDNLAYDGEKPAVSPVCVKKLYADAVKPQRGSDGAAGYDLCAYTGESVVIPPHTTVKIGTGISLEIPDWLFGAIFARSGIAAKRGLRPANAVGVVDSDYRGEIIVALHNDFDEPQEVAHGERIAQIVFIPYVNGELRDVEQLTETERGSMGFGSTGRMVDHE